MIIIIESSMHRLSVIQRFPVRYYISSHHPHILHETKKKNKPKKHQEVLPKPKSISPDDEIRQSLDEDQKMQELLLEQEEIEHQIKRMIEIEDYERSMSSDYEEESEKLEMLNQMDENEREL